MSLTEFCEKNGHCMFCVKEDVVKQLLAGRGGIKRYRRLAFVE